MAGGSNKLAEQQQLIQRLEAEVSALRQRLAEAQATLAAATGRPATASAEKRAARVPAGAAEPAATRASRRATRAATARAQEVLEAPGEAAPALQPAFHLEQRSM